jgi:hypothetical protein
MYSVDQFQTDFHASTFYSSFVQSLEFITLSPVERALKEVVIQEHFLNSLNLLPLDEEHIREFLIKKHILATMRIEAERNSIEQLISTSGQVDEIVVTITTDDNSLFQNLNELSHVYAGEQFLLQTLENMRDLDLLEDIRILAFPSEVAEITDVLDSFFANSQVRVFIRYDRAPRKLSVVK